MPGSRVWEVATSMGSKADFYMGRGLGAEWLGSIAWDGLPTGLPPDLRAIDKEDDWREEVTLFIEGRDDGVLADAGWPWTWDTSHGTKYTYAFDRGHVWACCYGSSWWRADRDEPDHTTLKRKAAILPDMSLVPKLESGSIFIVEQGVKPKPRP